LLPSHNFREAMLTLLREALDGPAPSGAFFLNRGDGGLLASLDALSAETASVQPGGRSSVAAHTDHLRYGLALLNRWAQGENPWHDANYAVSWKRQHVNEDEWRALREALTKEARAWIDACSTRRDWDALDMTEAFASVVHLAYHLGAIRQIAQGASGPKAND
jgi:hypothetical protein